MTAKPLFIVIEGLDGSGTTTQAKLLSSRLEKEGHEVLSTAEPTDGEFGKLARKVLGGEKKVTPETLQLLFCADRAEHLKNEIEPALQKGKIVISDRYSFSTIAYGGLFGGAEWLEKVNSHFREPDLLIFLRVLPAMCLDRIQERGAEKEMFEKGEKLELIWQHYERLTTQHDYAIAIDGDGNEKEVEKLIWAEVKKLL